MIVLYRRPIRPDELMHHGVKGMKWGVRRYQPYPHTGRSGTFLNQSRDEDVKIKKGTTAYRVQSSDVVDVSAGKQKYISFDKFDSYAYVAATTMNGGVSVKWHDEKGNGKDDALNIVSMKLTKDMIAPSYNKTMETFIDTVNDIGAKKFAKEVFTNSKGEYKKNLAKDFLKNYKNTSSQDCLDRAYLTFTQAFMNDTKAKNQFFDSLKKQGYTAIIDDNDYHYSYGFTKTPTIIFDSSNVKQTGKEKVSGRDLDYNYKRIFNVDDKKSLDTLKKEYKDVYKKYEPVYNTYSSMKYY